MQYFLSRQSLMNESLKMEKLADEESLKFLVIQSTSVSLRQFCEIMRIRSEDLL
jgi:hypothetical protein